MLSLTWVSNSEQKEERRESVELTIKGTPKEIADLVVQVQGRQSNLAFSPAVIGRIPKDFQEKIQKHYQDQCR